MTKEPTSLKLTGFEIEVEDEPVVLLMHTDQGPFSLEIPKTELSKLVYALRFIREAEEPLRKRRERKRAAAQPLLASARKPPERSKGK